MPSTASARLLLLILPVLFAAAYAAAAAPAPFDVAAIVKKNFSAYSDLLTKTKIADQINSRRSITVLVLDDATVGSISGLAPDVLKRVLAVHVLLDYYDGAKLNTLKGKGPTSVTTLYQTSGTADQRQGYVNITEAGSFLHLGSAMPGAAQDSQITTIDYTKPYDLSVIHISKAIIPPGIEKSTGDVKASSPSQQTSAPTAALANKTAPAPTPTAANAPKAALTPTAASTTPAGTPEADVPTASTPAAADAPAAQTPAAETPAEEPAAETPASNAPAADSPVADTPAADGPVAEGPTADGPVADGPGTGAEEAADKKSGAGRMAVGAGVGAVAVAVAVAVAAFMLGV